MCFCRERRKYVIELFSDAHCLKLRITDLAHTVLQSCRLTKVIASDIVLIGTLSGVKVQTPVLYIPYEQTCRTEHKLLH